MTLQIDCPNCQRRLEVAAEHAGKQIRCPACQHICVAPGAVTLPVDAAGNQPSAVAPSDAWFLRTPDGPIYGPIPWHEVEAWASEGRISAECQLGPTGNGPWQSAAELLPTLPRDRPVPSPVTTPLSAASGGQPQPTLALGQNNVSAAPQSAGYLAPDRGATILILGIMGFAIGCPLFSFVAWAMASHDLNQMRRGQMNRQGEALTLAGLILGMIVSLVWLVIGIVLVIGVLIALSVRW